MLEFIYNWLLSLGIDPEMAKNWTAPLLVGAVHSDAECYCRFYREAHSSADAEVRD